MVDRRNLQNIVNFFLFFGNNYRFDHDTDSFMLAMDGARKARLWLAP
jgi:hypothetical protein